MLHQTLIPSSLPPSVSASDAATAPPGGSPHCAFPRGSAMPSLAHRHSPLDAGRTDALKSNNCFTPEETAEEAAAVALVEKDGFSVEDLLDLEEFGEPEKDGADNEEALPAPASAAEEKSNEDSKPLSVVRYELPPPPPPEMVDLPAHDVEELEWVSRIMDDSLCELPPQPQAPTTALVASLAARPPLAQQRWTPHVHGGAYRALPSAAGPLRTPTICALSTEARVPVKAKRSKRTRGTGWSLSGASFLSDSASSSSTTTTSSCSSSGSFSSFLLLDPSPFSGLELGEGYYSHFLPAPPSKKSKHGGGKGSKHKPKKPGRKPKHLPPHPSAAGAAASQPAPGDRRCNHCGVQKTPQWRAGPEGAKTLCNACGVRYKSGRLLPEYRPACSPTFVSSIHSNSHRKVLEMRRKKEDGGMVATAAPAVASF
ncbi:GATA transcription factor 5 [Dichanthelium oligosanthes]|uniref:GATA transcription factor 5 n=1 Tax=Dichanthelium oligosanthes TaxID=888268 RepID=A0A1E5ULK3_9POAL|nr:GATA transcription factor 5 [Dichanthelium oligosanthes]